MVLEVKVTEVYYYVCCVDCKKPKGVKVDTFYFNRYAIRCFVLLDAI